MGFVFLRFLGMKTVSLLILKSRGESLRNFFAYSILAGMTLGCFESVVYLLATFGTHSQVSSRFLRMIFFADYDLACDSHALRRARRTLHFLQQKHSAEFFATSFRNFNSRHL